MRRLTGPGARIIILTWIAFLPFGFLLSRLLLFQILNSVCIASGFGVGIMFWQGEWSILNRRPSSWGAGDVLVIGVVTVAFGLSGIFLDYSINHALGAYPTGDIVNAFFRWIIASGLALQLIASGSQDSRIPSRAYRATGIVIAVGIGAALILMSLGIS